MADDATTNPVSVIDTLRAMARDQRAQADTLDSIATFLERQKAEREAQAKVAAEQQAQAAPQRAMSHGGPTVGRPRV